MSCNRISGGSGTDHGPQIAHKVFERLSENPTYKYILCDVRFEPNVDSPELDDSLYEAIAMTPRMVIPMHEGEEPVDARLFEKAGYCDYAVNFVESNFVKYEFYKTAIRQCPSRRIMKSPVAP